MSPRSNANAPATRVTTSFPMMTGTIGTGVAYRLSSLLGENLRHKTALSASQEDVS